MRAGRLSEAIYRNMYVWRSDSGSETGLTSGEEQESNGQQCFKFVYNTTPYGLMTKQIVYYRLSFPLNVCTRRVCISRE